MTASATITATRKVTAASGAACDRRQAQPCIERLDVHRAVGKAIVPIIRPEAKARRWLTKLRRGRGKD